VQVTGRRFAPLGVRPFGRLLTTYTVNEIGDAVGVVALAVLVYDRTEAVAPTAAIFIAAKFLPALIAPLLTALVDQLPLRRILPALYLLEAAAFAAIGLVADGNFVLGLVLALALVDGTLAITGRGLTRGAVASVLQPSGLLREGNAMMNVGFAVASVGGAALAGLLIGTVGLSTALYVDAASFLVIAVLLAATTNLPAVEISQEPFRARLSAGLRYARTHPPVRLLLFGQAVALVLFTLIVPIEVIYAKESLGTTSAGYGILLASWGAGIFLGSLLYLRIKNRAQWLLIVGSTLAVAVAYLGLAAAGTLLVACLISVIGGLGNGIQWIAVMTALQEQTARDYQARISGLMESLGAAMPGVGFLLGGAIVAASSPRVAYAVAGAGLVVMVLAAMPLRSRLGTDPAAAPRDGADHPPGITLPESITGRPEPEAAGPRER
jgi:predicted MFS family arabinose efflux permease